MYYKKSLVLVISLLVILGLLLSACGGSSSEPIPPIQQAETTLTEGDIWRGKSVFQVQDGWGFVQGYDDLGIVDQIWVNTKTSQFMRVCLISDCDAFAAAFRSELEMKGVDSKMVQKTTWNGKPAVVTPDMGLPTEWAIETRSVSATTIDEWVEATVKLYSDLYDRGVAINPSEAAIYQTVVKNGPQDLFIVDLQDALTTASWPDKQQYVDAVRANVVSTSVDIKIPPAGQILATPVAADDVLFNPNQGDFSVGKRWRGWTLKETADPNWFCIVRCRSGLDETWVTVRNSQIYFGRTATFTDATALAARTQIGVEVAGFNPALVAIEDIAGERIVVSPDMGMSWDAYWNSTQWSDDVAKAFIGDVKNFLNKAAEKGLVWVDDVGTHQILITPDGRAIMIDFESARVVNPGSYGPFGSMEKYQKYFSGLLDNDLSYDASSSFYSKERILATPPVLVRNGGGSNVQVGDIEVSVFSKIDGKTRTVLLTEEQVSWLRLGDARVIETLAYQGVPMPKVSTWTKIGRGAMQTFEVVGVAVMIYIAADSVIDMAGMGATVQASSYYGDVDIVNAPTDLRRMLQEKGYENTAIFRVTQEKTPQGVLDWYNFTGRENMSYLSRIDDPSILNIAQVAGIQMDNDIPTPIKVFVGDQGSSWVAYVNIETGENFSFVKEGEAWRMADGSNPGCTSFSSLVSNQAGTEYVDAEFEMCVTNEGVVTYSPTWANP